MNNFLEKVNVVLVLFVFALGLSCEKNEEQKLTRISHQYN